MRLRTALLRAALVLTLLAGAGAIALHWASRSETVLAWAVERVAARLPGKLTVSGLRGALVRPISIEALVYVQDELRVEARDVGLDWAPWVLLMADRLWISRLTAQAVTIVTAGGRAGATNLPDHLRLPLPVRINRLELAALRIERDGNAVAFNSIALAYAGDRRFHHLALDHLVSAWGELSAELRLQADRPFVLDGTAQLRSAALPDWPLSAAVALRGTLADVGVEANGMVRELRMTSQARVAPFADLPLRAMKLQATGIDLSRLVVGAPQAQLDLSVEGAQVAQRRIDGQLRVVNRTPGTLNADRLPVHELVARFSAEPGALELTQAQLDLGPGGRASGDASLRGDALQARFALERLDLRALYSALRQTTLSGTVEARQAAGVQHVQLDVAQKGIRVAATAIHDASMLRVNQLSARVGSARIDASGQIATSGPHTFAVSAQVRRMIPADFGDFPVATINGEVNGRGQLQPQWTAQVDYRLRDSAWRKQPLSGRGKLTLSARRAHDVDAHLALGKNELDLRGAIGGPNDRLDFQLGAPALSALGPWWAGTVQASGHVEGLPARPSLRVNLTGSDLVMPVGYRVAELKVNADLGAGDDPPIALQAQVRQLRVGGFAMETARVQANGTRSRHNVEFEAARHPFALDARLDGGFTADWRAWSGRVLALRNSGSYAFALESPSPLSISPTRVAFGPAALRSAQGRLTLGATVYGDQTLSSTGTLTGVQAAPLLALFGATPNLQTDLVLGGSWNLSSAEHVNGRLELHRQAGDVEVRVEDEQLAAGLDRLALSVAVVQDRLVATLAATAVNVGELSGRAETQLSKRGQTWGVAGSAPLTVSARAEVKSLKPLAALLSRDVVADGMLSLALEARGSAGNAQLSGRADGKALSAEQVRNGVFLHDGTLHATFSPQRVELQELTMRGGEGRFNAKGVMTLGAAQPALTIDWSAEELAAVQRPDLLIIASGAGTFSADADRIRLSGRVRADKGRVDVADPSAPALGEDVVVKGRKPRTPMPERILKAEVQVNVDLGSDFSVTGRGIDARLEGNLWLRSPGNAPLSAEGEISVVRGTYEAFGRKLEIDRGHLYFNGPLDNPALDIRALRKNQQVEAGVEVTGTARKPQVRLVSIPDVPDAEKLTWLTLGRPIEAGNRSDAATLQRSALALAAAVGTGSFQSQVAQAVDLDEVNLAPALDGSQGGTLTLAKRLSDRVYVLFEQNLSTAQNALKINYQLSRRWSIRTETGYTDAVDLFYTWSFD